MDHFMTINPTATTHDMGLQLFFFLQTAMTIIAAGWQPHNVMGRSQVGDP